MGVERAEHLIHNHVALSGWSAKGKRWSWQLLHLISQPQGTTFAPQTGTEHFHPSLHKDTSTTSLPPDDIFIGASAPYYSEANTDSSRFTSSIDHSAPVPIKGGARNPNVPILFQVVDVDLEVVRWVNADLVPHIVHRV